MSRFSRRIRKIRRDPVGYLLDSRHSLLRKWGRRAFETETEKLRGLGAQAHDRKITVIMTAYNTGHLIEGAVRSVLTQTHQNLELFVIDDASTDNTRDILADLSVDDARLRVFASPENHGTYWSKNWCLANATGEFVAFHDSDDYSNPERLQVQLGAFLANPQMAACTCRWRRVDDDGNILTIDGRTERMAAISLMIRRSEVLGRAGYFDTVRIAADTEYIRRLKQIFGNANLRHLRQCLYTGLLREGSLTTAEGSGFDWTHNGNSRDRSVGGDRAAYYDAFTDWHERCGVKRNQLKVAFPQNGRPFDVPAAMTRGCGDTNVGQVTEISPIAEGGEA